MEKRNGVLYGLCMNSKIAMHRSSVSLPTLMPRPEIKLLWRFLEFFTVNIRNANTRTDYARAAVLFPAMV